MKVRCKQSDEVLALTKDKVYAVTCPYEDSNGDVWVTVRNDQGCEINVFQERFDCEQHS